MNFFDRLLGRAPPVSDAGGLADFIDAHAAFVVQKGIFEYSRARAGHYSKVLFGEAEFQEAVERSRWRAYPLGLAMVAEVASAVLQETTHQERQPIVRGVADLTLSVFDRYQVPAVLDAETWRTERSELARRLDLIGLHPPKRAMDIPEPIAESYFALMPIHKSLRGQDFPTLKNYLKVTLCNVHDELTKRIDAQAVAGQLLAPRS
jgi:hypothetical protein